LTLGGIFVVDGHGKNPSGADKNCKSGCSCKAGMEKITKEHSIMRRNYRQNDYIQLGPLRLMHGKSKARSSSDLLTLILNFAMSRQLHA